MNKSNINKKHWRGVLGVWALAALTGALVLTTAGVASADYGQGAVYQIELVAQGPGGGGAWLWIALYPDDPNNPTYGTEGDYAGSDCAGGLNGHQHLGGEGAVADVGEIAHGWYTAPCTIDPNGTCVVIPDGVLLAGFGTECPVCPYYTTITVPSTPGHYACTDPGCGSMGAYMTWPFFIYPLAPNSFSQLTVAP
jgi:hypothetical protein